MDNDTMLTALWQAVLIRTSPSSPCCLDSLLVNGTLMSPTLHQTARRRSSRESGTSAGYWRACRNGRLDGSSALAEGTR